MELALADKMTKEERAEKWRREHPKEFRGMFAPSPSQKKYAERVKYAKLKRENRKIKFGSEVAFWHGKGYTPYEIADITGISRSCVYTMHELLGLPLNKKSNRGMKALREFNELPKRRPLTNSEKGRLGGLKRMAALSKEQRRALGLKAWQGRRIYKERNK